MFGGAREGIFRKVVGASLTVEGGGILVTSSSGIAEGPGILFCPVTASWKDLGILFCPVQLALWKGLESALGTS